VACALAAVVGALVLLRALTLGGEAYDAYEVRAAARSLADGSATAAGFPVYRSPLLVLVGVPFEALSPALAWFGPALVGALAWVALVALTGLLARRLGARPWVAACAALVVALDRTAWLVAPHGLPDVPAAALCAAVLWVAAGDGPDDRRRGLLLGLLVGLAALTRHNVGLVGAALALPLLARGPERGGALLRLALAGVVALALYGLVTTLLWSWAGGSLAAGLAGHGELLAFQRAQLLENRGRHGALQPPFMVARTLLVSAPALVLAAGGAWLAARGPLASAGARAALGWAGLHLVFVGFVAGHVEARYLTPALPALAVLVALALEALARRGTLASPRAATAAVVAVAAATLALGAPWEAAHALDRRTVRAFPATLAAEVERALGPGGRVVWTTTHPYPVAPDVLRDPGTPFRGDPFHGIWHLGPAVLGWHLGRPVLGFDPTLPGIREQRDLVAFARAVGLRPGDVLVVATPWAGNAADLAGRAGPWPPIGVGRVVGPDPVDVTVAWLSP
jgi:4-amino-4-deoxy-L-arabinose transferase-like glycosyltransferase